MAIIQPSRDFEGGDISWNNWTHLVSRADWSTGDTKKSLNKALRQAAENKIDKEHALIYVFARLHGTTEFTIDENSLRRMAHQAYSYVAGRQALELAGKDASPEGVKIAKFLKSISKKDWNKGIDSTELKISIAYSRRLNLSPEACQRTIEAHWTSLGLHFDSEELRKRIAQEP